LIFEEFIFRILVRILNCFIGSDRLSERSLNFIRNTLFTFIYRVMAILIAFITVPFNLKYLGNVKFGVWTTIYSILAWVVFFDLGIGNGMKNKVAEAIALKDRNLARTYISNSYFALGIFCLAALVVAMIGGSFLNLQAVFNIDTISNDDLRNVFYATSIFLILNFFMSLILQIFFADQKASLVALMQLMNNMVGLGVVLVLLLFVREDMFYLIFFSGLFGTLVSMAFTFYYFHANRDLMPSFRLIAKDKIKPVISLGAKFFILQITNLVIYSTDNIIIAQILGPAEVTSYQIVYKLFSPISIGLSIISMPLWTAYIDAYAKNDMQWIKSIIKKINLMIIPISLITLLMVIFGQDIIRLWVGETVRVDNLLIILMGVYSVQQIWNTNYGTMLAGTGKINLSLVLSVIITIANIPLCIYLAKIFSSAGVILATIICISMGTIFSPLQFFMITSGKLKKGGMLEKIFN
jgi:O-antigen/teichoic acid export membrane protein